MKRQLISLTFLVIQLVPFSSFSKILYTVPMKFWIEYQGKPYNGKGYAKIILTDASETVTYWSNDGSSVGGEEPETSLFISVKKGVLTIEVGEEPMPPLSDTLFYNPEPIYVRLWFSVNGKTFHKIEPMEIFGFVPLAVNSVYFRGFSPDDFFKFGVDQIGRDSIADGSITFEKIAPGTFGSLAFQNSDEVHITGGVITGIKPLNINDGGTGAGDPETARKNLGLKIGQDILAYYKTLEDIGNLTPQTGHLLTGNGFTWISIPPDTAREMLGMGSLALQNADNVSITGGTLNNVVLGTSVSAKRLTIDQVGLVNTSYVLSNRSAIKSHPVVSFQPVIPNTGITLDLFPKGNATDVQTDAGVAWIDIVDTDLEDPTVNNSWEGVRIGKLKNSYAVLGTIAAGTGVRRPLIIQPQGGKVGVNGVLNPGFAVTIKSRFTGDGVSICADSGSNFGMGYRFEYPQSTFMGGMGLALGNNQWALGTLPGDLVVKSVSGSLYLSTGNQRRVEIGKGGEFVISPSAEFGGGYVSNLYAIKTTDQTETLVAAIPLAKGETVVVEARIIARTDDGQNRAYYHIEGLFYREQTLSQEGEQMTLSMVESDPLWDVRLYPNTSKNSVDVMVKGKEATTISWKVYLTHMKIR